MKEGRCVSKALPLNLLWGSLLVSGLGYACIGYVLQRYQHVWLIVDWLLLFAAYGFWMRRAAVHLPVLLWAAVVFRVIFLVSIPALSDDFYRFLWDGHMIRMGVNPYMILPESYFSGIPAQDHPLLLTLLQRMNSPGYYTVYPPVLQSVFAAAAAAAPDSLLGQVVLLRFFIVAAEMGTLVLLPGVLRRLGLPPHYCLWYALNPLVIVELSGNLHGEAIMIFFLTAALRLFLDGRLLWGGVAYGLAIGTKLIPLLCVPLLVRWYWRRPLPFISAALVLACIWLPFVPSEGAQNVFSSLQLYFQKFSFNASLYYLLRWLLDHVGGYALMPWIGPLLSVVVFMSIVYFAWAQADARTGSTLQSCQWALTAYLVCSAVVHPWYVTTLVFLHALTGWRFAVVWSLWLVVSYLAYGQQSVDESEGWIAAEYVATGLFALWETGWRPLRQFTDMSTSRLMQFWRGLFGQS